MEMCRSKVSLVSVILLILGLLTAFLYAVHTADIAINERVLFKVGSTSTLDASERAAIINSRIRNLIDRGRGIMPVKARPAEDHWEIVSGDLVIMTVTEQDGHDFETSLEKLAGRWA